MPKVYEEFRAGCRTTHLNRQSYLTEDDISYYANDRGIVDVNTNIKTRSRHRRWHYTHRCIAAYPAVGINDEDMGAPGKVSARRNFEYIVGQSKVDGVRPRRSDKKSWTYHEFKYQI